MNSPIYKVHDDHTIQIVNDKWVLDGVALNGCEQIMLDGIVLLACSGHAAEDYLESFCQYVMKWGSLWGELFDRETESAKTAYDNFFRAVRFVRRNYVWDRSE